MFNNQLTESLKTGPLALGSQDKPPALITEFRKYSLLRERKRKHFTTLL